MENLTLFEQEVLGILKQLEYCCDIAEFYNYESEKVKKNKSLEINSNDISLSSLRVTEDIDSIEKYLWTKGLDFHYPRVELDYMNLERQEAINPFLSIPSATVKGKSIKPKIRKLQKTGNLRFSGFLLVPPATIKGESIEAIKTKIRELIDELNSKNSAQNKTAGVLIKDSNVVLDYETCVLKIGDVEIKFRPESDECKLLRIISEQEPHQGLEWDEIAEKMERHGKTQEEDKRFIGDTRDRINERVKKEYHTSETMIERKNNRYTISKKIGRP
ncbi:MAG: hypothetical protein Q7R73_02950 [bacterium]|nr:hypothetical protein [bacterium]